MQLLVEANSTDDETPAREPSQTILRQWATWKEELESVFEEDQTLGVLFGDVLLDIDFREYDYVFHIGEDLQNGSGEIHLEGSMA